MSKPSKSERYTARQPDAMRLKTQITGVFSEMPRGEMTAGAPAEVDASETQMPAGNMNGGADVNAGEMPSGQMTDASADQMAGLTESEMPSGQMASAQSPTDDGLTIAEMPSGNIQSAAQAETPTDGFPVLEIRGEWLLTLSPTSLKKSGN